MRRQALLVSFIWTVRLVHSVARLLPLRPRVVLATAHIAAIRGNLAAIQARIQQDDPSVRIVTLVHDRRPGFAGQVRAYWHGIEAAYHLATARLFVVDSHFLPVYIARRRPGTTVVQVWHACGAIKKIGYSVLGTSFGADETLTGLIRIHSNYDICLAASRPAVEQYVEAFRQPAELFVTSLGIPRTDVLLEPEGQAALAAGIRARFRLPPGKRVVLYAPTFRGNSLREARTPAGLDLALLQQVLGEDHVVLLRQHPAVRRTQTLDPALAGFVIDASDYPEMNELLLVTDVLVTDYSSVIFEFALLGRPMAFFAPDADQYEESRGFYFDYRAGVPGPVFDTSEALAAYLRAGTFDLERIRAFAATWFDVADGHASERFVKEIVVPVVGGRALTA